ncbi:Plasmid pRiA4b ORF-3-like protein [Aquisphaera giovannonii]|uniref:Plasmid pRiA4b ORF-3-like protein n=1 Tax=Aquisphaera giovannonii TaxID=406548 RepID=A0A5B9WAC3_9BACT|nr:plasmid pRiA4b ORF-3 family protein [Aquisphaera giovannonii]QEH37522.1 Plasmid pRiA4b ORF-3-like protein [Aquisphaera giovannonii]
MKRPEFTPGHESILRAQVITEGQPGAVLHDFAAVLDALGPDGVEAAGKHHLLPIKLIPQLDAKLAHPLKLAQQRPQVRSHPYIQALNLLLRASGLSKLDGKGQKARLVLDAEAKMQWDQLNPTERYFNLLEAAFRIGRGEMVGEDRRADEGLLLPCLAAWAEFPQAGWSPRKPKPEQSYPFPIYGRWYLLALMDLFGLVEVTQPRGKVERWYPGRVRHTPFGDAVMPLLFPVAWADLFPLFDATGTGGDRAVGDDEPGRGLHQPPPPGGSQMSLDVDGTSEGGEDEGETLEGGEVEAEHGEEGPRLGEWQPIFVPYFPEWRRNLTPPAREVRDGTLVFRVSHRAMWRLIAIPSGARLDSLAAAILDSIGFDHDHLYEFVYTDGFGASRRIYHHAMEEAPSADSVAVGRLPLDPGDRMIFHYDFGDDWEFAVELERIDPPGKSERARVLQKQGKSPAQYGGDDWS